MKSLYWLQARYCIKSMYGGVVSVSGLRATGARPPPGNRSGRAINTPRAAARRAEPSPFDNYALRRRPNHGRNDANPWSRHAQPICTQAYMSTIDRLRSSTINIASTIENRLPIPTIFNSCLTLLWMRKLCVLNQCSKTFLRYITILGEASTGFHIPYMLFHKKLCLILITKYKTIFSYFEFKVELKT